MFPPSPIGLKGREHELAALRRLILEKGGRVRIALVGSGGSGKSMLAAALGHRLATDFGGRIEWFRVGAWDARTLMEMLALRFGVTRTQVPRVLAKTRRLIVLDNHEDDAAMARLLGELVDSKATFVVTARRCLLSGVLVYPVTAPLVTSAESAFPTVASLTRRLRWNPLALDMAASIVASGACTEVALRGYLDAGGVNDVHVVEHEDDLPEVALLVAWMWERISAESQRVLGVLSHIEGDNIDVRSLSVLANAKKTALAPLVKWHVVQEALPGRFTAHAVVKHAVRKRTPAEPGKAFEYFVSLLERSPERVAEEQTHLFAAMDHAHRTSDLNGMLRVERLLASLGI